MSVINPPPTSPDDRDAEVEQTDAIGVIILIYLGIGILYLVVAEALISNATMDQSGLRIAAWLLFLALSATLITTLARRDVRRRQRAARRQEELGEALDALSRVAAAFSQLGFDERLDELVELVARLMAADEVAVLVLEGNGPKLEVLTAVGADGPRPAHSGEGVVGQVVADGRPAVGYQLGALSSWEPLAPRLSSVAAYPLRHQDEVIGVMYAGTVQPRRFHDRELQMLDVVASRSADAIQQRALFDAERRARLGEEHARRHLALLASLGEVLAPSLPERASVGVAVADVLAPSFATLSAVAVVDEHGELSITVRDDGTPVGAALRRATDDDAWRQRLRAVLASPALPLQWDRRERAPEGLVRPLAEAGAESLVVARVGPERRPAGALVCATGPALRGFRPSDRATLEAAASRVEAAFERVDLNRVTRQAAESAERRASQLRRLAEAATEIISELDEDRLLALIVAAARRVVSADTATVTATTEHGRNQMVTGAIASPAVRHDLRVALVGAVPGVIEVARTGGPFGDDDRMILSSLGQLASVALAKVEAYQASLRSEHRLLAIVESSPVGIVEVDGHGEVVRANTAAARIFGTADDAMPVGADLGAELAEVRMRAMAGEVVVARELTHRTLDGTPLELSVSAGLVPGDGGGGEHVLLVMADVTVRRRFQQRVEQAQRLEALGRMAGAVAHDYNNLLTVILGYTELVMRRLDPDDPSSRDLEAVRQAGEQARTLADQLLTLSRRRVVQPEVVDPKTVVATLEGVLRRLVGDQIKLDVQLDHEVGRVLIDPGQLEQVLLNLAGNARDAMPDGGRLSISSRSATMPTSGRPGIALLISDTGAGMDEATRARCFEPFFTTKPRGEGTGLGLATVDAVVTQAGGELTVTSVLGRGTTFVVVLPRVDAEVTTVPEQAREVGGTEAILLVEDEDAVRSLASDVLSQHGYTVIEAASGPEAIEHVRSGKQFAALVSDVVMPAMTGVELARRVEILRPGTPVLFLSGYAEDPGLHPDGGRMRFLPKPYAPGALLEAVRATIDGAPATPPKSNNGWER